MDRNQFVEVLKQAIRANDIYGVIHIAESWSYFPRTPNDHTMKQVVEGEIAVSELKPGDKTDVPMLEVGGSYATASNSLIDASYFAIKNITVGYTLPKRWLKKIDIESLRIYATLDNIAMFNHMDGMDPQYNFTGSVAYSYTPSRVIAFGIDLNF